MKKIQEMSSKELVNHRNYIRELVNQCNSLLSVVQRGLDNKYADEQDLNYLKERLMNSLSKNRKSMDAINIHMANMRDEKSKTCKHPTFTEIVTSSQDSIFECTECGYLTHELPNGSKCVSTDWKL